MRFPTTERQARLLELADRLAGPIAARAEAVDRENRFPTENFEELRAAGYLALTVPERYGGLGADPLELALAQERIAHACGSTGLASTMHLSLLGRLAEAGSWPEPAYARLCRDVVERGALVNAINSEPDLGSPSRGALPTTRAVRTAGGWLVSGRKSWASLSPALSWMYCLVSVYEWVAPPRRGNILIPADAPGVRVEETWRNLGMRATASHDVVFEDVLVPADHLLPAEAPGAEPPNAGGPISPWFIFPGSAVYLGIAQAARDAAVEFARSRRPNGMTGPIAELQTVQHKAAEMDLRLLQARTLLYDTADRWVNDPAARTEMAWQLPAAKYVVTETALSVTDTALRLVGSAALAESSPLQRLFRDARTAIGHPPMADAVLTLVGKTALGLLPDEPPAKPGAVPATGTAARAAR